jgi:BT4734-like, N-terminal domain
MTVSMVRRCHETDTHPITFDEIWDAIRTGKHGLKEKISQIRNRYEAEKDITGSAEKAKKAISDLKLELPGFLPVGTFSKRENAALVEYSGILCADLDTLGDKLPMVRESLKSYKFVRAIALSPSGDGLKVFFNVINEPARHEDSFRAIQKFMRDEAGLEIDEKCKDLARICFFPYDENLSVRMEDNEILPPADPLPRGRTTAGPPPTLADINMPIREQIAFRLVGEMRPDPLKGGYFCRCPGESFHSNKTGEKHTKIYLDGAPNISCQHTSCAHVVESFNTVLQGEIRKVENPRVAHRVSYRDVGSATILANPNGESDLTPKKPHIKVWTPKQLKSYEPPPDIQLVGDCHIIADKSHTAIIGGPGGVGKSLALNWLAIAGATGEGEWFGMPVHRKFKTFIIQNENSPFRLAQNFRELDCDVLEDYVRIIEPPEYGMLLHHEDFRKELVKEINNFIGNESAVIAFDPFNAGAPDQEQRTYLDTFSILKSLLPAKTGLVIAHHLRKPQTAELSKGRSLMFMLAGSYVLTSVPRAVFVMQPASDDVEDDQVVWTCSKNNNGELGKRSAWKRCNGVFKKEPKFDWDTFDSDSKDKRVVITQQMVEEVFQDGQLLLVEARDKLHEMSGATKSSCYRALSESGRFGDNLTFKGKFVNWVRS